MPPAAARGLRARGRKPSMHEVLESTWHSAQHARQLIVVLDSLNRAVDGRLSEADLRGLPLPEKAWDDDK